MADTFATRLKVAMREAGMNQLTLSTKCGASKASICQYLSGKNNPGVERTQAIANALGVSVAFLLGYERPVEEPKPMRRITIQDAARCMGKSAQFIRIGLQRKILTFGDAVPSGAKSWSYYISPTRFKEYVGAEQYEAYFGKEEAV